MGLVRQVLAETGLSPDHLEVELTESGLLALGERTTSLLHDLRDTGVRVAIDDFGTGYSSLSYLRRFRVDKLKIDRSFVNELSTSSNGLGIVQAIVAMARAMNLEVQAEGVELKSQLKVLQELGCDSFQGFLRAAPMPAIDMTERLRTPEVSSGG